MAYRGGTAAQSFVARVGAIVVGGTVALTLSFFGLVAFIAGRTPGVADRVPFYVLAMAVAFVVAIIALEQRRGDPRTNLVAASAAAAGAFGFVTLAGEGLLYAARNPEQALAAHQLLYLVAAGLIATGVGYWGLRHWREVADLRL